jgi:outer membrane protein OmpA-like peptidoglycan-associated protein
MKHTPGIIFSTLLLALLLCSNNGFGQAKGFIKKAEAAFYKGDYEKSRDLYLEAIKSESDNYQANMGLGILLNEYMEDYEQSLPYLEKAHRLTPATDTIPELILALGKAYHFIGRYTDALEYYQQMLKYNDPDDNMFQEEINKYIEDCKYALKHSQTVPPSKLYVVNAGKTVNTVMEEYVPVLTKNNQLIFTSKRQDVASEKINDDNGKYFESMYISEIKNGRTAEPQRYVFSDSKINSNESVVSVLPGGNKIIIYKDSKLYEGDITKTNQSPSRIAKMDEIGAYQNHAFLCKNETVLYFTSETAGGFGGDDIYKSIKQADGTWGQTENLGENINTMFDEESPFLTDDGNTLYFASRGHLGYGGFDIYKSTLENGKWTVPVNLGSPINSPANDLFFVVNTEESYAYFSSSRKGGYGEMDIYKINYTEKVSKECTNPTDNALVINATRQKGNTYNLSATVPQGMEDKILDFNLMVNDSIVSKENKSIDYTFNSYGNYTLKAKVVAWCDTCINLFVACNEQLLSVKSLDTVPAIASVDLTTHHGKLTDEQAKKIGFDLAPVYFDFNDMKLRTDAINILEKNIELLKKYPNVLVTVNGYTDSRGSSVFNKVLSEKRANDVKKYLIKNGIDKKRIRTVGRGEENLLNDCGNDKKCDEEMHQLNRRVEFELSKK